MRGIIRTNTLLVYFLLFMSVIFVPKASAQELISGQINTYAKVTAVGIDYVDIVADPGFSIPDTLLLIQMKGVQVDSTDGSSSGGVNYFHGTTGYYEFLVVQSIVGTTVSFTANIMGAYDVASFVQLIDVARYEDVSVDSLLEAQPWDPLSGTGGVLALISEGRLELNADIDVSGQGFKGGISDAIPPLCIDGTNNDWFNLSYFHEDTLNAGRKGESAVSNVGFGEFGPLLNENYARGKGKLGSGGGGGNGKHSGGGGGGSYETGGRGGKDFCTLASVFDAGEGGSVFNFSILNLSVNLSAIPIYYPVIMGSGGGASTSSGGTPSDGGNGGGIVFILADTIQGNGHSIKVNGEEPSVIATGALDDAGAGGGGAAGAAVIYFSEYNSSDFLYIEALGGDGGSTELLYGEGGGGSGGLVFSNFDLPSIPKVVIDVSGGNNGITQYGTANGSGTAGAGSNGIDADTLALRLNGFLFNSIVSSKTGNPVDSICYGTIPPNILGTQPIGGDGLYTYLWKRSYDNSTFVDYPGTTNTPNLVLNEAESSAGTVYFQRVVTSDGGALIDESKSLAFKIIPSITTNTIGTIGNDTIICNGQTPDDLIQVGTLGGGNGIYEYKWHSSLSANSPETWSTALGAFDQEAYDVPALTDTTYYYREVFSGRCYDTTTIATIIVLPSITNNIATADQVICVDRDFSPLLGSVPANGDGSYIYEWRVSTDTDTTYSTGSGINNAQNYTVDKGDLLADKDMFLRRFVWSGADNVCVDSTAIVKLKMWSVITGNVIGTEQTIRAFLPAALLDGTAIGGSDPVAVPTFLWEDSTRTNPWAAAQGININETYQPGQPSLLADTTWYRRIVWKAECSHTSNTIVINVHPLINNDFIRIRDLSKIEMDTTICEGQTAAIIKGSQPGGGDEALYTYTWQQSSDSINFVNANGVINGIDYDPGTLNDTTYFRRKVVSGEADHYSDIITIKVLTNIAGNTIGDAQTICYNIPADKLEGSLPTGGDGIGSYTYLWEESTDNILWASAAGLNTNIDFDPGALTVEMYYRRNVVSGLNDCCKSTSSSVMIGIHALPTGAIVAVPDDTSCAGEQVLIGLNLTGLADYTIILSDANGGSLSFSANANNYTHSFNPTDPYDYTYSFISITDANGCVATSMIGSQNHKVYANPVPGVTPGVDVCGLIANLNATPSAGTGQWYSFEPGINASSFSDPIAPISTVTVDEYRTYTFWWRETNWQCKDSTSLDIRFDKAPNPAVAGPDAELLPLTTTYTMQADAVEIIQATEGTWTMIDNDVSEFITNVHSNSAEVSNLVDGEYNFVWTVINGTCPAVTDQVLLGIRIFKIYSAFSPNNDNINEKFVIDGLVNGSSIVENEFVITDMSGTVVYKMKNYDNSWDGKDMNGNILPDGTYYYFLRIEGRHISLRKGYVIIKRGY